MSPPSCSACVPRIATAIASSHMRIRPQLPMFTTSETAPMVQKFVRLATAPKMNARTNPPAATRAPRLEVLPATTLFRKVGRYLTVDNGWDRRAPRRRSPLAGSRTRRSARTPVARRGGDGDERVGARGAVACRQVGANCAVRDGAKRARDAARGTQFGAMALPVVDGERVAAPAVAHGDREDGGRIEPAGDQDDGRLHRSGRGPLAAQGRKARARLAGRLRGGEARDGVLGRVARASRVAVLRLNCGDGE